MSSLDESSIRELFVALADHAPAPRGLNARPTSTAPTDRASRHRRTRQENRRRTGRAALALGLATLLLAVVGLVAYTRNSTTSDTAASYWTQPWRTLPDAPVAAREGQVSVWTGHEMLVFGGASPHAESSASTTVTISNTGPAIAGQGVGVEAFADGAAYSPTTGAWRAIAHDPWGGRTMAGAVWTGREMMLVGGSRHSDGGDAVPQVDAYDPATDSWRLVTSLPPEVSGHLYHPHVAWLDDRLYVSTAQPDGTGEADTIWRFGNGSWTELAPRPELGSTVFMSTTLTQLVVIGERAAAVFSPDTATWGPAIEHGLQRPLAAILVGDDVAVIGERGDPMASATVRLVALFLAEPTKTYSTVHRYASLEGFAAYGQPIVVGVGSTGIVLTDDLLVFDGTSRTWAHSSRPPTASVWRLGSSAISTGNGVIVWGGRATSNGQDRQDPNGIQLGR